MTHFRYFRRPLLLQFFLILPLGGSIARWIWLQQSHSNPSPYEAAILSEPALLVSHMITACLFVFFGAFQMSHPLRNLRPRLHKRIGYLAWASGLAMGLTGVAMVAVFPIADGSEPATQVVRLIFGLLLVWWSVDGLIAALQRDFTRHRGHMLRAYMIGVAATTNAVLFGLYLGLTGQPIEGRAFTVLLALGWILAVLYAEWRLRKPPFARRRRIPARSAGKMAHHPT